MVAVVAGVADVPVSSPVMGSGEHVAKNGWRSAMTNDNDGYGSSNWGTLK